MVRRRWIVLAWSAAALAGCPDEPEPLALCDGVTCSDHGVCRTDGFTASCDCDERYHAQGLACVADGGGDADADGDAGPCPAGMVLIEPEGVCIDAYEASHGAADTAVSEQGRQPWTHVTWAAASAACGRADKALCTSRAWLLGCGGPDAQAYPYGATFGRESCVDVYTGVEEPMPTGSMPGCEGYYEGLFDMSGNVAEWTADVVDGDALIAVSTFHDDADRLLCNAFTPVPTFEDFDDVGFRCCLEL